MLFFIIYSSCTVASHDSPFFLSRRAMPISEDTIANDSLIMPATEPIETLYVSIHPETGIARILESLGMPMKKLTTAIQEARQVKSENQLFQVSTVEIIATEMKIGSQTIPPAFFGSRLTKMISLIAAIVATAAPEYAPMRQ